MSPPRDHSQLHFVLYRTATTGRWAAGETSMGGRGRGGLCVCVWGGGLWVGEGGGGKVQPTKMVTHLHPSAACYQT